MSGGDDINSIIHGANPENLYRAFGLDMPPSVLDFSTNTNILPWPAITLNIEELASHYPDPECQELRAIISEREGISQERILFTNGTNEAIFLLAGIFAEGIAILQPCYSEYTRAFTNSRGIFSLNEAGRFQAVILANPNNPTGEYIPDLARIVSSFPETMFIIDEAYIDFVRCCETRERLYDFDNVILLRSLTKIFHLSGVRCGYVIASEDIITKLKDHQPSWSVNAIAQELAVKFLNDRKFYDDTLSFYRKNTPEFMLALRDSGFEVRDSDVHYFLVGVDDDMAVMRYLLGEGIAVRHTRNFKGFDGRYIRVATRYPSDNNIFVEAMRKYRERHNDSGDFKQFRQVIHRNGTMQALITLRPQGLPIQVSEHEQQFFHHT